MLTRLTGIATHGLNTFTEKREAYERQKGICTACKEHLR